MTKILPFRWYGGKYSHLNWILPRLPRTSQYIEPFGGSAAVLLNREPTGVETYNDIDGDVVNFFRVLRENRDELLEKIALTPFSRDELTQAVNKQDADNLSDIERARLFFVRAGQTRSGLAQEATPGRWAYCKGTSRRGMSGSISRYHGRLENLYQVADRLRRVQIENKPACEVIDRHDDEDSLFYCDPPYPHEVRGDTNSYGFEMDDEEHCELAERLDECEGYVAVSSYRSDLYDKLFLEEGNGWMCIEDEKKTMHTTKDTRQEVMYVNYDPIVRDIENIGPEKINVPKIASE